MTWASLAESWIHLSLPDSATAVLDPDDLLSADDLTKLTQALARTAARFPQARWRLMIGGSPAGWPSRLVSFSLVNLAPISPWTIAGHLDPKTAQATVSLGHAWEPFFTEEDLNHCLQAASATWQAGQSAAGWLVWLSAWEKLLVTRADEITKIYA
jgi:hypothetical protein